MTQSVSTDGWYRLSPDRPIRVGVWDDEALLDAVRSVVRANSSRHRTDPYGRSGEFYRSDAPELEAMEARLRSWMGLPLDARLTFRYRAYEIGHEHPSHVDAYVDGTTRLVATVAIPLSEHVHGGETVFEGAGLSEVAVPGVRGGATWWDVVTDFGEPEARTTHAARVVRAGTKETLLALVWRDGEASAVDVLERPWSEAPERLRRWVQQAESAPVPVPDDALAPDECPGLFCVQDGAPPEQEAALRVAAEARGVPFWPLRASRIDLTRPDVLPDGALLYTIATSMAAMRAVERLWHPGVGTIFTTPLGPLQQTFCQPRAFEIAGIPVPSWCPLLDARVASLQRAAEALGGFPLVARHAGGSCGFGIVRLDSLVSLRTWAELVVSRGMSAELVAMEHGTNWRVAVVDGRVAGHCRNVIRENDFRSMSPSDPSDYRRAVPPRVVEVAIAATEAVGARLAGVDVLEREDGSVVVFEANVPFYFAGLQQFGHDVAGAIVESMLRDAKRRVTRAAC